MSRPDRTDVLILGGGIIGLSIAYELSRRGRHVTVLERDRPGGGATAVAAGMLGVASDSGATPAPMVELGTESLHRYPEFVRDVERDSRGHCEYVASGSLLLAFDHRRQDELEQVAAEHRRLGLRAEELSAAQLRKLEPLLADDIGDGYLVPDDAQVNPRALARALIAALQARGVEFVWPGKLLGLDPASDDARWCARFRLQATGHALRANSIVVAAGAWSASTLPDLIDLPVRPVKGQVVRLSGPPQLRHIIRTPDVYLVPRPSGELMAGASSEDCGFDPRLRAGPVLHLLSAAKRALPSIEALEIVEIDAGFRPALPDRLPVLGATAHAGLYVATGHFRNGILLAPATAALLADLIVDDVAAPILTTLGIDRLGAGGPTAVPTP